MPGIENYLNLELKALENGFPMLKIPGAFEYNDVLDLNVSKYLAGEFSHGERDPGYRRCALERAEQKVRSGQAKGLLRQDVAVA